MGFDESSFPQALRKIFAKHFVLQIDEIATKNNVESRSILSAFTEFIVDLEKQRLSLSLPASTLKRS